MEIKTNEDRARYANRLHEILVDRGKGRTFGAQCCAFVADHPDEAKALSDHHIESFFQKKMQYMRPQVVNKFIIHNDFKNRRIKNAGSDNG